jgi:diacylglycerol O-acyltransferase
MAQRHLDRLTPVDASFLHQEDANAHMHLGALVQTDGEPLTRAELLEQIRERLHLVPRYRQKLAFTRLDAGRPVWIDDHSFDPEFHVRHTALPAPGSFRQLQILTARIFSQPLDRSRPLWEMWLVEGLREGGCALISKNHHCLIDGIAGMDLATVLFDLSPQPEPPAHPAEPWRPHREPSRLELLGILARSALRSERELAERAIDALASPENALRKLRDAAEGLGEVAWALLNPAPPTPLNVPIGPYRRFIGITAPLDDLKAIKNLVGGTVNDVVLAVVTGALRSFLIERGVRTEGLELRALVPVSVRAPDEHGAMGNRIVAMRAPLPVYIADPIERLRFLTGAMADLKESKQALGAQVITDVQNFTPPTLLAQASRLQFSTRLFNLLVTNVPGPQFPLYVRGRLLRHAFPIAFLPNNHALAIAMMSYNGEIAFSLLADFDALPDVELIGDAISEELATLLAAARGEAPTRNGRRSRSANGRASLREPLAALSRASNAAHAPAPRRGARPRARVRS